MKAGLPGNDGYTSNPKEVLLSLVSDEWRQCSGGSNKPFALFSSDHNPRLFRCLAPPDVAASAGPAPSGPREQI